MFLAAEAKKLRALVGMHGLPLRGGQAPRHHAAIRAKESRRRIRADRAQGSDRLRLFEQNFARQVHALRGTESIGGCKFARAIGRCKRLHSFVGRTKSVEEQSALAVDQQLVLTCERVTQSSAFALGSRPAACRFGRDLPSRRHRLAS